MADMVGMASTVKWACIALNEHMAGKLGMIIKALKAMKLETMHNQFYTVVNHCLH